MQWQEGSYSTFPQRPELFWEMREIVAHLLNSFQ